jgi:RHS repeat-associated protein
MAGYQTGAGNRLTNDGTWTYTYDDEGNVTQKSKGSGLETVYYSYDNLNRLTNIRDTSDGTTNVFLLTYTYDVENNRVQEDRWKTGEGSSTTRFVYDASGGNVVVDMDGSNTPLARRMFGDGTDQVLLRTQASGTAAGVSGYFTDNLGSVRDVANASGAVKGHIDYTGFGVRTDAGTAWTDRFSFQGLPFQADVGAYETTWRFYDPVTGRWLTQDPIDFGGGDSDLYRADGNDPVNNTDPTGQNTEQEEKEFEKDLNGYQRTKGTDVTNKLKKNDISADGGAIQGKVFAYIDTSFEKGKEKSTKGIQIGFTLTKGSLKDVHWLQFIYRYKEVADKDDEIAFGDIGRYTTRLIDEEANFRLMEVKYGVKTEHIDTSLVKHSTHYYDMVGKHNRTEKELSIFDAPGPERFPEPKGRYKSAGVHFDTYLIVKGRPVYRVTWKLVTTKNAIGVYEIVEDETGPVSGLRKGGNQQSDNLFFGIDSAKRDYRVENANPINKKNR